MNKKGSVMFFGLMLGLTIIVLALALSPAVQEFTENAGNYTNSSTETANLDCQNTSISNFDRGTCVVNDLITPYFIVALVLIGGAVIAAKIIG